MKKFIPGVVFLAILLGGYFLSNQMANNQKDDCTGVIEKINQENEMLKQENQRISKLIEQYQKQKDSLLQLVKQENQKVIDLRRTQHEKVQAIDHFTNDELLDFFAGLEANSAEDRE